MLRKLKEFYHSEIFTLRVKLIAIISLLILVSLILFTGIALNLFQEDMTEMVTVNNNNNVKMLSNKLESELRNYRDTMRLMETLANQGTLIDSVYFKDSSDFLFVAHYNFRDSELQKSFYRVEKLKKYHLNLERVKSFLRFSADEHQALRANKSILKSLDSPQNPAWLYAIPVSGNQAIIAVLSVDSLVSSFSILKSKGSNRSLYAGMLVDSNHRLIAHSDMKLIKAYQDMKEHPAIMTMRSSAMQSGVKKYVYQKTTELGSFQKLVIGDAVILTTVNENIALEGVRWARIMTILIALLIIALAILFIYFFSRTISDPIRALVEATQKIHAGDYQVYLESFSQDEVGQLTDAFNDMAIGLKEREQLKGAFGKYVSEEVANMVMRGDLSLEGESKTATVFFSDIRSFTSISEKLSPQQVVEFLNEYLSLMVGIIHQHNGIVDKFIGDAIMAIWGAPFTRPNDAENAVLAALKMREALAQFNQDRGSAEKPLVQIGMSVNTGELLAGQIGSHDRLEYTVIGDTVNLGARLERFNKIFGTDILISHHTYEIVKNSFNCIQLQRIKVKGKKEIQMVYAVLGKIDDPDAPKTLAELHKRIQLYPDKKKITKS